MAFILKLLASLADFGDMLGIIGRGLIGLFGRRPSAAENMRSATDVTAGVVLLVGSVVALITVAIAIFQ